MRYSIEEWEVKIERGNIYATDRNDIGYERAIIDDWEEEHNRYQEILEEKQRRINELELNHAQI